MLQILGMKHVYKMRVRWYIHRTKEETHICSPEIPFALYTEFDGNPR